MFTIQKTLVTTFILLAIFTTSLSAGYEVRIHVNYPHDVVYAGYLNDVEIWIENSTPLYMIRLPLLYSSNIGAVAWHSPYGTVPASSPYISIDDDESAGIWELPPDGKSMHHKCLLSQVFGERQCPPNTLYRTTNN